VNRTDSARSAWRGDHDFEKEYANVTLAITLAIGRYSERSAMQMAFDLLRKHEIKEYIEQRKAELLAAKKMM
jgi:phage terminase small subunit